MSAGPKRSTCSKAWNTGQPGGIATFHANGAKAALLRLEQLVREAVVTAPQRLIQIVFALSIAFAAWCLFLSFFSFGDGALVS